MMIEQGQIPIYLLKSNNKNKWKEVRLERAFEFLMSICISNKMHITFDRYYIFIFYRAQSHHTSDEIQLT